MVIYFRSFMQNVNNQRFRTRKNKQITHNDSSDIDQMSFYDRDTYQYLSKISILY